MFISQTAGTMVDAAATIMMQQPMALPIFLCLPERVSGIPMAREILPFAEDIPSARFHENEKPYFLPMVHMN